MGHIKPADPKIEDGWHVSHRHLTRFYEAYLAALRRVDVSNTDHLHRVHQYFHFYIEHLKDHHDFEEELLFPTLLKKTEFPHLASKQHKELLEIVGTMIRHFQKLLDDSGSGRAEHYDVLLKESEDLAVFQAEHFEEEETHILPLYREKVPHEEHKAVEKKFRRRGTLKARKFRLCGHIGGFKTEEDAEYFIGKLPWIMRKLVKSWRKDYAKKVTSLVEF
mmetsp:Transcript_4579/g.9495  ORF Transcript_4579/g.9495 Transcript_4579/m.9495 type:complete len:220 (-) Transcript_4579:268-927(-)